MKIQRMRLCRFMSYDEVEVELPSTGLVLVTGGNGQGKSALIEAAPAAGWNKTLRGTPWYRDGEACSVQLVTDAAEILRERTAGGKNKVSFSAARFDTATKAQPTLESLVGDFDVWRKTSVFSSAAVEGSHFSSGTDAERKRLLEAILGLDKFDEAFARCGEDLRVTERNMERAEADKDRFDQLAKAAEQRMKDARDSLAALHIPDVTPAETARKLGVQISALLPDLDVLKKEYEKTRVAGRKEQMLLASLQQRAALLAKGQCPTCEQPIAKATDKQNKAALKEAEANFKRVTDEAEAQRAALTLEIEELEADLADLRAAHRSASDAQRGYEQLKAEKTRLDEVLKSAVLEATRYATSRSSASVEAKSAAAKVNVLDAARSVLGMRGVRAHILNNSLGGLTAVANKWLQRMSSDFTIELSPYTEKKAGGVSDSIAVNIDGAGGGHGYKACSAGQRRRVDVAIILGLATMASAAHGIAEGTLFFDEVFDVLDEDGTIGVAAALDELARGRCVVVVSHSDVLQRHVTPAACWHVEGGSVLEL